MMRAPLALFAAALVAAVAWPVSQAIGAVSGRREPPLCREMTPAKMLEHPVIAEQWAEALRSAQPEAIARVRTMIEGIRAAHGCTGEPGMPAPPPRPSALPPGHPPIPGSVELPPGHPPVAPAPPIPLFEAPALLEI